MQLDHINLDDVREPQPLEEGEYKLKIIKEPELKRSENTGRSYISVLYRAEEQNDAALINDNLMLPIPEDDAAKANQFARRLKQWAECFEVPFSGSDINIEAAEGNTGFCLLGIEHSDDYGDKNRVKRFLKRQ